MGGEAAGKTRVASTFLLVCAAGGTGRTNFRGGELDSGIDGFCRFCRGRKPPGAGQSSAVSDVQHFRCNDSLNPSSLFF